MLVFVHKRQYTSSQCCNYFFPSSLFYLSSCTLNPIISDFGHRKTGERQQRLGCGALRYGAGYFDTSAAAAPAAHTGPSAFGRPSTLYRCSRCVRVRQVYVLLRLRRLRNGWAIEKTKQKSQPGLRTRRCEKYASQVSELRGVSDSHWRAASDLCT